MEAIKIWLLSVAAAIMYGILHDEITARVCVEYFTIGHPRIFPIESPTLLALGWGILATWWVGAGLGIFLALAARAGSRPPLSARDLIRPLAALLQCMAVAALLAGIAGFFLAVKGAIHLHGFLATAVPVAQHARFMADWWAHSASYLVGSLGGIALCIWVFVRRGRPRPLP